MRKPRHPDVRPDCPSCQPGLTLRTSQNALKLISRSSNYLLSGRTRNAMPQFGTGFHSATTSPALRSQIRTMPQVMRSRQALFVAAMLGICLNHLSLAQQSSQTSLGALAANAWMRIPTPVTAGTDVSTDLKRRRDLFFDSVAATINLKEPLTPESAGRLGLSEGSRLGGAPEIPSASLRSIVIGSFLSSRSVLTESRNSIYTEIKLRVTDVFEDFSGSASPNTDITLALMGGTVETVDKKIISLFANERRYSLQPARIYLLVLTYNPDQEFYMVVSNWDFTTGIVAANSGADRELELRGGSRILGLTKDKLSSYLSHKLRK
jgi:hypothetical protein